MMSRTCLDWQYLRTIGNPFRRVDVPGLSLATQPPPQNTGTESALPSRTRCFVVGFKAVNLRYRLVIGRGPHDNKQSTELRLRHLVRACQHYYLQATRINSFVHGAQFISLVLQNQIRTFPLPKERVAHVVESDTSPPDSGID